jgi:hypothetical protein
MDALSTGQSISRCLNKMMCHVGQDAVLGAALALLEHLDFLHRETNYNYILFLTYIR